MRDYKKEYSRYHSKPEQKKRRAQRNAARAKMIFKGLAKKGDGKDVDHKDRNPFNNAASNLRIQTKKVNRGRNK
jgi:hypothetical protein